MSKKFIYCREMAILHVTLGNDLLKKLIKQFLPACNGQKRYRLLPKITDHYKLSHAAF
jgi:hypothetical protein